MGLAFDRLILGGVWLVFEVAKRGRLRIGRRSIGATDTNGAGLAGRDAVYFWELRNDNERRCRTAQGGAVSVATEVYEGEWNKVRESQDAPAALAAAVSKLAAIDGIDLDRVEREAMRLCLSGIYVPYPGAVIGAAISRALKGEQPTSPAEVKLAKVRPIAEARERKERKTKATAPTRSAAAWADGLLFNKDDKLRKNHANLMRIFAEHPAWKGVIAYDEFRCDYVKLSCPPTEKASKFKAGAEWTETDTTRATAWLQKTYGVEFATGMVLEALLAAGEENKFHPIETWLTSLKWDGKPRLDSFLADCFGVTPGAYASAVGSKWMISAVARTFEPGCQVDHMLVLEGEQGGGKSSGIRKLAPDPSMVADTGIVIGDKDSYQNLRGKWIYELAELASVKGREVEKIKQFLSSPKDTYRASYARKSRDWPRTCVFIGTTNEYNSYLADSTGNRRIWPVRTGLINLARIVADRPHLWAEAVHRYKAKETWHLDTAKLQQLASDEQDKRAQVDPWVEYITTWLRAPYMPGVGKDGKPTLDPIDPDKGISTGDIAQGAIGLRKQDTTPAVETKIGRIMAQLDWDRRQARRAGERVWLYFNRHQLSPVTIESLW